MGITASTRGIFPFAFCIECNLKGVCISLERFYAEKFTMKILKSRKIYAAMAFAIALTMLAGCSSDGQTAEGSESISINVIGSDPAGDGPEGSESSSSKSADTETVIVTDEGGETVTGVNGEAVTAPANTEALPEQTMDDAALLDAMTATSAAPQLIIEKTNSTGKYAYSTLTDKEKELYDAIVDGVENLRFKICKEDDYTIEEWTKIYMLVYNQEPHLFYMATRVKVGKLFYTTNDPEQINTMKKSIDAVADKLVSEAAGKSSTFEKLKVFHDYIVLNSTFELKEDGSEAYNASIYNAFGSGEAQGNIQCAGYAKAVQYLCDKAGIDCMVITGENDKGESHAWNIIDVDGAWYNFDTTWDDPILTTPNYKNLRYSYFLVPDKWITNSHLRVNQKKMSDGSYITFFTPPACTETAQNYFVKNGLVCSDKESADKALRDEIKKAAEAGSRSAHVMVSSKDVYDAVYADKMDYNSYAKEFSGVKGVSDGCLEDMLLLEFDVIYN